MDKIHAKLKQKPEDFIVEEIGEDWSCKVDAFTNGYEKKVIDISKIDLENKRDFLWCEMEKINTDHFSAMQEIAKQLKKPVRDIGYAGSKDKKAWTSQRISIFKPSIELLGKFQSSSVFLKNFKWNKRKIKIGYLNGNKFKIILRDVDPKKARNLNRLRNIKQFPNFFGVQRFGINGRNFEIGKLIFKRDFQKAVKIFIDEGNSYLKDYLEKNPEDFLKGLLRIDRKTLLMIAQSVQSKIYNEILERAIEEKIDFSEQKVMLAGYRINFSQGRLGEIEKEVLEDFGLSLEDFDLKEISFLRLKGTYRRAFSDVRDLKADVEDDEMFSGSKKIILEFGLDSGVYATTLLESFFDFDS